MAFSCDNQSVFISDYHGNIKIIKWKAGANSEDEFDFTQEPKRVGDGGTYSICLTKDEKYLLVGSNASLCVFETATSEVTKQFKLKFGVRAINLIKNGNKAIITEMDGNLYILDLETLEISLIAQHVAKQDIVYHITII